MLCIATHFYSKFGPRLAQSFKRVVPGIHVAAIWFSHMTKSYASCMDTIQKTYGFAIHLLYGYYTAGIWQSQMPALWYAYGVHMAKPYSYHMDTIQEALWICHMAAMWYLHMASI